MLHSYAELFRIITFIINYRIIHLSFKIGYSDGDVGGKTPCLIFKQYFGGV